MNNVFLGNISKRAGGGLAVLDHGGADIYWNTFIGNQANGYGSAIAFYKKARKSIVANCIFAQNKGSDVVASRGGDIEVRHSLFYDNQGLYNPPSGHGNILAAPLFVQGPNGPYYLAQTSAGQKGQSPCVDRGMETEYMPLVEILTTRTDKYPDSGPIDNGYHYFP